jgi:hypothetical protein
MILLLFQMVTFEEFKQTKKWSISGPATKAGIVFYFFDSQDEGLTKSELLSILGDELNENELMKGIDFMISLSELCYINSQNGVIYRLKDSSRKSFSDYINGLI